MAFDLLQFTEQQRALADWAGPLTLPLPAETFLNGVNENQPDPARIGPGVRRSVMITLGPKDSPRQVALMIWAAMAKVADEGPWNLTLDIRTHTGRQGNFYINERGDLMIPSRNGGNRANGWKLLQPALKPGDWTKVFGAYAGGDEPCLEVMALLHAAGIPCRTVTVPDPDDATPAGESPLLMYVVQVQGSLLEKARRVLQPYIEDLGWIRFEA